MVNDERIGRVRNAQSVDVLIAISSLQFGGAETQALLWAKNLKRQGLSVFVVSVLPGSLKITLEKESIPYRILVSRPKGRFMKLFAFIKSLLLLNNLISKKKPRKLITFLYIESLQASILKLISRSDFQLFMGRRADFGYGERGKLQNWILRFGYQKAEHVFTNSNTNLESAFKEGVDKSKVTLIENYLRPDLGKVKKMSTNVDEVARVIKCMTVGSLSPVKNHSMAVSMVNDLEKVQGAVKVRLDIYGEGELRAELEKRIGGSKAISLLGNRANPWLQVEMYDFYLHTSQSEGSSNALWEAAACGLPIVTTQVGDYVELQKLTHGSFFIANNREEFMYVFKKLVSDLEHVKSMAQENAFSVRAARSDEKITKKIVRMLGI